MSEINTAQTLRNFFFEKTVPAAEVLNELKKLTPEDKADLINGIIKINGQIFYKK